MLRGRIESLKIIIAAIMAGAIVILSYQNCGNVATDTRVSPLSADAPFAYRVTADTYGLMSCDGMNTLADPATFFTVRVAALRSGSGIGLTQDFLDYAKQMGKKTTAEIESFLDQAPHNRDDQLQLSVRNMACFRCGPIDPLGTHTNFAIDNFTPSLSKPTASTELAALTPGQSRRQIGGRNISGQVDLTQLNFYQQIRPLLADTIQNVTGMVVLGFHGSMFTAPLEVHTRLVSPADHGYPGDGVYGEAYHVLFSPVFFPVSQVSTHGAKALGTVKIYQTAPFGPTSVGQYYDEYQCLPEAKYRIVRSQDVCTDPSKLCRCDANATNTGLTVDEQRAFDASDALLNRDGRRWYIDQKRRCIIPANSSVDCYQGIAKPVQYNAGATDFCDGQNTTQCLHFFSHCLKIN